MKTFLRVIETVQAVVDLPGSVLALIKVDKDQLGPFIKRSLAVEFFREGRLSLSKAAELAGVKSKWEMVMLLSESVSLITPQWPTNSDKLISSADRSKQGEMENLCPRQSLTKRAGSCSLQI